MCEGPCRLGSCRWSQMVTDPVAVRGPRISESQAVTGGRGPGSHWPGLAERPRLCTGTGGLCSRGLRGSHSRHSATLDPVSALS